MLLSDKLVLKLLSLTPEQTADLTKEQEKTGKSFQQLVLSKNLVSERELTKRYGDYIGVPFVTVEKKDILSDSLKNPSNSEIHFRLPVLIQNFNGNITVYSRPPPRKNSGIKKKVLNRNFLSRQRIKSSHKKKLNTKAVHPCMNCKKQNKNTIK